MKLFFLLGVVGTGYGLYIAALNVFVRDNSVEVALYVFAAIFLLLLVLFSLFNFLVLLFEARGVESHRHKLHVSYYLWPDAQVSSNSIKTCSFYIPIPRGETGRYRAQLLYAPPWRFVLISDRTKITGDKDALPFLKHT